MTAIRKATVADIHVLLALVEEYWRFDGISEFKSGRVGAQLQRLMSEPQLGSGWIATIDGAEVGYLLAVYVFSLEHLGITAEVDEFFILPPNPRLGIDGKLLNTAEAEFRRVGCTNVSLQLSWQNNAARAFYRRHQYAERSGYELLDKMLHGRQSAARG